MGEEKSEEELSDVALVELVMSANAPTLVDPDDDDVPLEAPSTTQRDVIEMLARIKEWMEWSDHATANDIDSVDALHESLHRRYVARLKQSEIPFERKEKKMKMVQILHLDNALRLISVFCVILSVSGICTVILPR